MKKVKKYYRNLEENNYVMINEGGKTKRKEKINEEIYMDESLSLFSTKDIDEIFGVGNINYAIDENEVYIHLNNSKRIVRVEMKYKEYKKMKEKIKVNAEEILKRVDFNKINSLKFYPNLNNKLEIRKDKRNIFYNLDEKEYEDLIFYLDLTWNENFREYYWRKNSLENKELIKKIDLLKEKEIKETKEIKTLKNIVNKGEIIIKKEIPANKFEILKLLVETREYMFSNEDFENLLKKIKFLNTHKGKLRVYLKESWYLISNSNTKKVDNLSEEYINGKLLTEKESKLD